MASETHAAETLADHIREQTAEHTRAANPLVGVRGQDILDSAGTLLGRVITHPAVAARQYLSFLGELGRILTGGSELVPDAKDKRFADPAWKESFPYRALAQCYLGWGAALNRFVDETKMDKRDAERVRFVVSLVVDAMSPTNWLGGNPTALKRFVDTGGASFVHGLENLVGDLAHNGGLPAQVDKRKFTVGKNLATTPGSVVYRTPVMELIQYQPVNKEVHSRPLLIAPGKSTNSTSSTWSPRKALFSSRSTAACRPLPSAGKIPRPPRATSGSTPTLRLLRRPWT
jgi:polyhydroxyalkanoate synthase subunit PhaC